MFCAEIRKRASGSAAEWEQRALAQTALMRDGTGGDSKWDAVMTGSAVSTCRSVRSEAVWLYRRCASADGQGNGHESEMLGWREDREPEATVGCVRCRPHIWPGIVCFPEWSTVRV